MFPELLKLGPITIRTYGFFVALGFFAGMQYVLWRGKQSKGFNENQVLDVILYSVLAGLLGARLTYVFVNLSYYLSHPASILKIWEGGLVFYGGFAASAIFIYVYSLKNKLFDAWNFLDLLAPAIALGHFFGRIGCFFAGCCYGLPCGLPWSVKFSNTAGLAPLGIYLHPTQLYEALGNIVLFFFLDWYNKYEHTKGEAFGVYLFMYSVLRFNIEFVRGDDRGAFFAGMSPSQLFSVVMLIVAVTIIYWRRNYEKKLSS